MRARRRSPRGRQAGDPDPLVNTVTAIYTARRHDGDRDTDECQTNLFQPDGRRDEDLLARPDPGRSGRRLCVIVVTNRARSTDSPDAGATASIIDTLTGNLLDPANTAVVGSTCTATLADGAAVHRSPRRGRCSPPTRSPLVNTVTVHYNPVGFPNDITDSGYGLGDRSRPPGGEGCTPGFWKQEQHFDSWVGFAPTDSFDAVFGVDVTLGMRTKDDPCIDRPDVARKR